MDEWVDNVLGKFSLVRMFLTWDSFACHITDSVKKNLARNNVDVVVIQGGCTKYIQPPDVSCNKPFKQHITEIMMNGWLSEHMNTQYKGI